MEVNYMLAYGSADASLRLLWKFGLCLYFCTHTDRQIHTHTTSCLIFLVQKLSQHCIFILICYWCAILLLWDLFCLKVSQSWTKILCKIMFFLFKFVFYVMNVIRVSWNLLIWLIGQGVSLIWWGCDLIFTEFIFYISRLESICPTILMIYLWVMIATALLYIICAQMISHMVLL